jgi:hypothetical protein
METIVSITLYPNNYEKIEINSNYYAIIKIITDEMWKFHFSPNELNSIYNNIVSNFESEVNSEEYEYIKKSLAIFVSNWWKIDIKYDSKVNRSFLKFKLITWGIILFTLIILVVMLYIDNPSNIDYDISWNDFLILLWVLIPIIIPTIFTKFEENPNIKLFLILTTLL